MALREGDTERRRTDIRRLTHELRTAQQQNSTHERTLASLRTDLQARDVLLRQKERESREREAEMSRLHRELRTLQSQLQKDAHQKDKQQTQTGLFASLQRLLQSGTPKVQSLKLPLELRWKQCQNMPFGMRSPCSVILNGKVYVGGGFASGGDDQDCTVMVYDLQSGRWDILPQYGAYWYGMAVVNNQLVLVGGVDRQTGMRINQLSVWDERSQQWKSELLPPMTTPRSSPSVCTYIKWLVVAGGCGEDGDVKTFELLDTATKEWYTAASLPQACSRMTSAVVGDTWYLLGGFSRAGFSHAGGSATAKVFSVSLPDLISRATSRSQSTLRQPNELWQELPDSPLIGSAALALHGSLLAVGGCDDSDDLSAIHLYQPDTRKWVTVGDLPSARSLCSSVSLPSEEFLVLGGYCDGNRSEKVDMGTILN